jgi:hypothetical protein
MNLPPSIEEFKTLEMIDLRGNKITEARMDKIKKTIASRYYDAQKPVIQATEQLIPTKEEEKAYKQREKDLVKKQKNDKKEAERKRKEEVKYGKAMS